MSLVISVALRHCKISYVVPCRVGREWPTHIYTLVLLVCSLASVLFSVRTRPHACFLSFFLCTGGGGVIVIPIHGLKSRSRPAELVGTEMHRSRRFRSVSSDTFKTLHRKFKNSEKNHDKS